MVNERASGADDALNMHDDYIFPLIPLIAGAVVSGGVAAGTKIAVDKVAKPHIEGQLDDALEGNDRPPCTETRRDPAFEYTARVQLSDGRVECPAGYTDTHCGTSRERLLDGGCSEDGGGWTCPYDAVGGLQCKKEYVSKCTETARDPAYDYTARQADGTCPAGFTDTGCQIRDGGCFEENGKWKCPHNAIGRLQCKKKYVSVCTETARDPAYDYTVRQKQPDGQWVCPAGFVDTGCQNRDAGRGRLQCKKKYVSTCTETTQDPAYDYTVRQKQPDGQWVCPAGYVDTGCQNRDAGRGRLQCKKKYVSMCTETSQDPGYEYTTRQKQPNGQWACPTGFTDTGCGWRDKGRGHLQCKKKYPVCTETSQDPAYEYTVRQKQSDGQWACPVGFTDTGCGWKDKGRGHLQCKKKYVSTCTEASRDPAHEYTVRQKQPDGQWACPVGFTDTGCGWKDKGRGFLQCKKKSVS